MNRFAVLSRVGSACSIQDMEDRLANNRWTEEDLLQTMKNTPKDIREERIECQFSREEEAALEGEGFKMVRRRSRRETAKSDLHEGSDADIDVDEEGAQTFEEAPSAVEIPPIRSCRVSLVCAAVCTVVVGTVGIIGWKLLKR